MVLPSGTSLASNAEGCWFEPWPRQIQKLKQLVLDIGQTGKGPVSRGQDSVA